MEGGGTAVLILNPRSQKRWEGLERPSASVVTIKPPISTNKCQESDRTIKQK